MPTESAIGRWSGEVHRGAPAPPSVLGSVASSDVSTIYGHPLSECSPPRPQARQRQHQSHNGIPSGLQQYLTVPSTPRPVHAQQRYRPRQPARHQDSSASSVTVTPAYIGASHSIYTIPESVTSSSVSAYSQPSYVPGVLTNYVPGVTSPPSYVSSASMYSQPSALPSGTVYSQTSAGAAYYYQTPYVYSPLSPDHSSAYASSYAIYPPASRPTMSRSQGRASADRPPPYPKRKKNLLSRLCLG